MVITHDKWFNEKDGEQAFRPWKRTIRGRRRSGGSSCQLLRCHQLGTRCFARNRWTVAPTL